MSKHWTEPYDATKHESHMWGEGLEPEPANEKGPAQRTVYFVRVCGFTSEFHSLQQLATCLRFYESKTHPSSRRPSNGGDHWERQSWSDRLPGKLMDNHRRPRVVKALAQALVEFSATN